MTEQRQSCGLTYGLIGNFTGKTFPFKEQYLDNRHETDFSKK